MTTKPVLALVMMIKNEAANIEKSLECLPFVDEVFIGDTGSTDNTVRIVKKKCKKKGKTLHLKNFEWKEYGPTRNDILEWCNKESKCNYFLLMDGNDELRNGDDLRKFCAKNEYTKENVFLLKQEWWDGYRIEEYFNFRLIRRNSGWHYEDDRHEYLCGSNNERASTSSVIVPSGSLYQDRRADNAKTALRFASDREYFLRVCSNDKKTPRRVFYLAQSCECIGNWEEAIKYYEERSTMKDYEEEVYISYYRSGKLAQILADEALMGPCGQDGKSEKVCETNEEYVKWMEISSKKFHKAFHHSARAEPLYWLAMQTKDTNVLEAYMYIKMACDVSMPVTSFLIVEKMMYNVLRWEQLMLIAYFAYHYLEGEAKNDAKRACEKSCNILFNVVTDKERIIKNLQHVQLLK